MSLTADTMWKTEKSKDVLSFQCIGGVGGVGGNGIGDWLGVMHALFSNSGF